MTDEELEEMGFEFAAGDDFDNWLSGQDWVDGLPDHIVLHKDRLKAGVEGARAVVKAYFEDSSPHIEFADAINLKIFLGEE